MSGDVLVRGEDGEERGCHPRDRPQEPHRLRTSTGVLLTIHPDAGEEERFPGVVRGDRLHLLHDLVEARNLVAIPHHPI